MTTVAPAALAAGFPAPLSPDQRRLVEENVGMVYLAASRHVRKYPVHSFDDAVSAGMLGLTKAALRFRPEMRVRFATFASAAVAGAMVDDYRDQYHSRRKQRLSMVPHDPTEPNTALSKLSEPTLTEELHLQSQESTLIWRVVSRLSQRDQKFIWLYFVEELNQERIAEHLGVSASRVCQIKTEVMQRLKLRLIPALRVA